MTEFRTRYVILATGCLLSAAAEELKWNAGNEALLREHEQRGELVIADPVLKSEFWSAPAREPRMPATRPEHLDLTYHWLKPPNGK